MITVTAAVIEKDNKVLCARRKPGLHLEGHWEFPGGKIEQGESPEQCLQRELNEEFGITSQIGDYIGKSVYHYDEKSITLLAYFAKHISGTFQLIEHDEICWCTLDKLLNRKWAPADIPLIHLLLKEHH